MACNQTYPIPFEMPQCIQTLGIVTGSTDETLKVRIVDKFNHVYYFDLESDSSGLVTIPLDSEDIPDAWLNEYSGEFTVSIKQGADIFPFEINGKDYEYIKIKPVKSIPSQETFIIDIYGALPTYN